MAKNPLLPVGSGLPGSPGFDCNFDLRGSKKLSALSSGCRSFNTSCYIANHELGVSVANSLSASIIKTVNLAHPNRLKQSRISDWKPLFGYELAGGSRSHRVPEALDITREPKHIRSSMWEHGRDLAPIFRSFSKQSCSSKEIPQKWRYQRNETPKSREYRFEIIRLPKVAIRL